MVPKKEVPVSMHARVYAYTRTAQGGCIVLRGHSRHVVALGKRDRSADERGRGFWKTKTSGTVAVNRKGRDGQ